MLAGRVPTESEIELAESGDEGLRCLNHRTDGRPWFSRLLDTRGE